MDSFQRCRPQVRYAQALQEVGATPHGSCSAERAVNRHTTEAMPLPFQYPRQWLLFAVLEAPLPVDLLPSRRLRNTAHR